MSRNLESEFDTVKDDLSKLRSDISALTDSFQSVAKNVVRDNLNGARERFEQWKGQATDRGRETFDDIAEEIEDRPLTSVLVAFGIGVLLGRLLDR